MAYINFKEEKSVLKEQIQNRKKNNDKLYNNIIKHKIELKDYTADSEYSYNKIVDKLIGKKCILDEEKFYEITNKDIICTKFIGCSFKNVKFKECRFIACVFEDCNFNGGGVIFENCIFFKEDSEKLPSLNRKDNLGCSFYNCNIYAKFLNCDLSFIVFENSKIENTCFELTDMKSIIIAHSELNMIEIIDCDLSSLKTFQTYIVDIQFDDKYQSKFDEKTFFDKIVPRVKDKQEYEGIYMTYETLAYKFKENSLDNSFGEYYYLAKCTEKECAGFITKIGLYIYWLSCGYGERPLFCILSSLGIIFIFSILYLLVGIEVNGEVIKYTLETWNLKQLIRDFNEAINLSVGMFTGVGFNNSKPIKAAYIIANFEMLIGVIMAGIGIGTLTRKVVR